MIISTSIGGVLLYLLASASSNSPFLEHYYPVLLGLNALSAVSLLLVVGTLVLRLFKRYRAGQFGTKLMARFALAFALMGVIPGALIYLVSVQFLSRSIDTWFDVRVDKALEAGLALGRTTLDGMVAELTAKARTISNELSDVPDAQQSIELDRVREQAGVQHALLFTASGKILASALDAAQSDLGRESLGSLTSDLPPANVQRELRLRRSYAAVESMAPDLNKGMDADRVSSSAASRSTGLRTRVIVPVPRAGLAFDSDPLYLQLMQRVPQALADNAEEVQDGARDYQELSLSRIGLRKIYTVTLTLTLLLSICAALATAFLLSIWLTAPLLRLAEGTRAVASGDYSPMEESHSRDELGTLTQSFNAMTRQLEEARLSAEHHRVQQENANAYLESILSNMSAGVLVLDENFRIATANEAADRILEVSFSDYLGQRIGTIPGLAELDAAADRSFSGQSEPGA
ncbi:MAG TPA: HAMP domain-containing protein, partial [Burkholderiales bacterium]|nr:HAMP domain-containing protein [Burkholderiales bacterium]